MLANHFVRRGVQVIFMPVYSLDFSPAESVCKKTKTLLKQDRFQELILENLKIAIGFSIQEVTSGDMLQFYKNTGFFNVSVHWSLVCMEQREGLAAKN